MNQAAEILEPEVITEIAEFREFETNLAEYKSRYEGVVYDLDDEDQEKQARTDRLAIGKVISKLDSTHKEIKAPLKEKVDLLDGERKRIKDQLLGIQGGIKTQIAEHEAKKEAHEAELQARVEAIKALAVFDCPMTSELITDRLEQARATEIDESFEHYTNEAGFAKLKALETLEPLLAGVKAQEEAAAEEERKRQEAEAEAQRQREEQIAREATERAEKEAEARIEAERQAKVKAEQEAKEAAERAEREAQERLAVEQKAREQAEQDARESAERAERERLEAEQRAKDAEARAKQESEEAARHATEEAERAQREKEERERLEAEAREADKKHRGTINRAAAAALSSAPGMTEKTAKAVVTVIANGLVPNVKIIY